MEDKTFKFKHFKQSGKELASDWQRQVYDAVARSGNYGITDNEMQTHTGKKHGSTSSALSTLHKNGHISRLTEKRHKNTVYVHPSRVGDRDTLPPMTNKGLLPRECTGECKNPACLSMESFYVQAEDRAESLKHALKILMGAEVFSKHTGNHKEGEFCRLCFAQEVLDR